MAFGYKLPAFNVWGRAWKPTYNVDDIELPTWVFLGYFRCQLRASAIHDPQTFQLEVVKGLAFKPFSQTPFFMGYRIQLAGWEDQWAVVYGVADIGAGFPNEHRTIECGRPRDFSFDSVEGFYMPRINTSLAPPDGAVMMAETPPSGDWVDPNQGAAWNSNEN